MIPFVLERPGAHSELEEGNVKVGQPEQWRVERVWSLKSEESISKKRESSSVNHCQEDRYTRHEK